MLELRIGLRKHLSSQHINDRHAFITKIARLGVRQSYNDSFINLCQHLAERRYDSILRLSCQCGLEVVKLHFLNRLAHDLDHFGLDEPQLSQSGLLHLNLLRSVQQVELVELLQNRYSVVDDVLNAFLHAVDHRLSVRQRPGLGIASNCQLRQKVLSLRFSVRRLLDARLKLIHELSRRLLAEAALVHQRRHRLLLGRFKRRLKRYALAQLNLNVAFDFAKQVSHLLRTRHVGNLLRHVAAAANDVRRHVIVDDLAIDRQFSFLKLLAAEILGKLLHMRPRVLCFKNAPSLLLCNDVLALFNQVQQFLASSSLRLGVPLFRHRIFAKARPHRSERRLLRRLELERHVPEPQQGVLQLAVGFVHLGLFRRPHVGIEQMKLVRIHRLAVADDDFRKTKREDPHQEALRLADLQKRRQVVRRISPLRLLGFRRLVDDILNRQLLRRRLSIAYTVNSRRTHFLLPKIICFPAFPVAVKPSVVLVKNSSDGEKAARRSRLGFLFIIVTRVRIRRHPSLPVAHGLQKRRKKRLELLFFERPRQHHVKRQHLAIGVKPDHRPERLRAAAVCSQKRRALLFAPLEASQVSNKKKRVARRLEIHGIRIKKHAAGTAFTGIDRNAQQAAQLIRNFRHMNHFVFSKNLGRCTSSGYS